MLAALDDDRLLDAEETLWDAFFDLDFDQLRRHAAAILARAEQPDETGLDLRKDLRDHLRARLDLADLPVDAVWALFEQFADDYKDEYWNKVDHDKAARLIEALARHGDPAAKRAMEIVESAAAPTAIYDPREVFAIQLLEKLRHRPALDLLVRRFAEAPEDEEVLYEVLVSSVATIGGEGAVPLLEARFTTAGEAFRAYASETLARIKHPDAEAAVLRLLDREQSADVRDSLALALCDLITTDGLPLLRRAFLEEDYDPGFFDLKRDLVVCSMMTGYDFPELGSLREEVIAEEVERDRRFESGDFGFDDLGDLGDEFADMGNTRELLEQFAAGDLPAPPPDLDDHSPPVTTPIRNDQPKVGRNDPCPCGSGKKYKKCCGK
jgi:hypothetical protein